MKTPALSPYSQQLWVIAKLSTLNNDGNNSNDLIEIISKMYQIHRKFV